MTKRIYQEDAFRETETDEVVRLVNFYFSTLEEYSEESRKYNYKSICNFFRKVIGIDTVLTFMLSDKKDKVGILEFGVKATADNFYIAFYDEEKREYYIEVEDDEKC